MKQMVITRDTLSQGIEWIDVSLKELKINSRDRISCMLSTEEMLDAILSHSKGKKASVSIHTLFGKTTIRIASRGKALDINSIRKTSFESDDEEFDAIVRQLMNKVLGDNITLSNVLGLNICSITVEKSRYQAMVRTLSALVLGLLCGILLKFCAPETMAKMLSTNLFAPISTMFMNALKMIVGPLVFFSMASSIADFSDLRSLGRVAVKVIAGYLFTSIMAITIGYFIFQLFPIGDPSLRSAVTNAAAETVAKGAGTTVSIRDTIVNIVPTSFASPFVQGDMLQLIFMGTLLGIGVSALSYQFPEAKKALTALNAIFSKITGIIIGFLPFAVFSSMAKMVISMNLSSLFKVAVWIPVAYFGDILMILFYCFLILLFGLNPLKFLKGFMPAMFTAYSLGSSNAAMPTSLECCEKGLGINKRIYSFSIPLGATINMDGSCILLMMSSLFMAKIFGITISGSELTTLIIAIMALSIGAPGVPGGALVCLSMLLPQIGIPAEGISLVMGIYTLAGMGLTAVNVTGDAAISTIVAKNEKMLDLEKYNAN